MRLRMSGLERRVAQLRDLLVVPPQVPVRPRQAFLHLFGLVEGFRDIGGVADEEAAIRAYCAWSRGDPPAGRPFEIGADTSKIAMGGVMRQCCENNGKLKPLFYWNGVLTLPRVSGTRTIKKCTGCCICGVNV